MPIVRFLLSFRNKVAKSIYSVYYYVKEIAMKITEDDIKSWVTIILGIIWYSISLILAALFMKSGKLLIKLKNMYGDTPMPLELRIWWWGEMLLILLAVWVSIKYINSWRLAFFIFLLITLINYWFYYTYK